MSQDVIIREDDCGTERGLPKRIGVRLDDGRVVKDENAETAAYARSAAVEVTHPETGEVLVERRRATSATSRSTSSSTPASRR